MPASERQRAPSSTSSHAEPRALARRRRRFAAKRNPLPQSIDGLGRQTMSQLPCEHDQLTAVVRFVRDEIAEEVRQVGRKVLPPTVRRGAPGTAIGQSGNGSRSTR